MKKSIADKELAWMFENCFPNTLDTTVQFNMKNGKPDTFVITGDIPAMWLRDSTAQVWPYLPFAKEDKKLKDLLAGVVNRQTACVLIDPYANAFNDGPGESIWESDFTDMKPELHERKWEVDSLCYVIRLAYGYWKATDDTAPFDDEWLRAMKLIVKTFREQQRKDNPGPYSFQRKATVWTDTQVFKGYGMPTKYTGMIHSMFRPSDDACMFPYLIPSNMFAVVSLMQLKEMVLALTDDKDFAHECSQLAQEVDKGIQDYAILKHPYEGEIYAYEVDGFGNAFYIDDANIPNLISLPYLGYCENDAPLYKATRNFSLGEHNPFYSSGKAASGIGGMHTPRNSIWHLGIIMQGLTSTDKGEIASCISELKNTHADTGFMHESFNKDDARDFTRSWFAWANTLFGEFIIKVSDEHPELIG